MKPIAAIALSLFAACALDAPDDELTATNTAEIVIAPDRPPPTQYPTCAALGCSVAPSSNPFQWAPCTTTLCYCYTTACTR